MPCEEPAAVRRLAGDVGGHAQHGVAQVGAVGAEQQDRERQQREPDEVRRSVDRDQPQDDLVAQRPPAQRQLDLVARRRHVARGRLRHGKGQPAVTAQAPVPARAALVAGDHVDRRRGRRPAPPARARPARTPAAPSGSAARTGVASAPAPRALLVGSPFDNLPAAPAVTMRHHGRRKHAGAVLDGLAARGSRRDLRVLGRRQVHRDGRLRGRRLLLRGQPPAGDDPQPRRAVHARGLEGRARGGRLRRPRRRVLHAAGGRHRRAPRPRAARRASCSWTPTTSR